MGRVWILEKAFNSDPHPVYRHRIAVKTFDFMDDEQAIERELNIWISLDHPSIVPLKRIGRLNYRIAAIMPLFPGSLSDVLRKHGAIDDEGTARVMLAICDGLAYAWSRFRVLHLDLKPANVLTADAFLIQPRIADWGISRLATHSTGDAHRPGTTDYSDRTSYGAGTPLYMAPERFSGEWALSPAADVFACGMIALELSTGVLPFRFNGMNPVQEIVDGTYLRNAHRLLEDRSKRFREFCLRCLHPDPNLRPHDYDSITREIRSISRS